jgi:hypothetical protein
MVPLSGRFSLDFFLWSPPIIALFSIKKTVQLLYLGCPCVISLPVRPSISRPWKLDTGLLDRATPMARSTWSLARPRPSFAVCARVSTRDHFRSTGCLRAWLLGEWRCSRQLRPEERCARAQCTWTWMGWVHPNPGGVWLEGPVVVVVGVDAMRRARADGHTTCR